MGLWNKSLEEILERYNAKLEGNYPRHVASAFFAVSYDDSPPASEIGPPYPWPRDEEEIVTEAIEAFAQRWGGLSDEIFLRALHKTQGRDHLVALFALGYDTTFPAEEVLSPFLASEDLLERCAAAIVLGLRHDERAIPVLEEYLLADVPLIEVPSHLSSKRRWRVQPEAEIWFSSYRQRIVGLVTTWGRFHECSSPKSVSQILGTRTKQLLSSLQSSRWNYLCIRKKRNIECNTRNILA